MKFDNSKPIKPKSALIAMSGGIDSTVAALLMQQDGAECAGATMKVFEEGAKTVADARAVALSLGMTFYEFDFMRQFAEDVINPFIAEYRRGHTPNPCIICNRHLKFGSFLDKALELGMDCIVTGHYVQNECNENGRYLLKKGADAAKDQSYVLYSLKQEQLKHIKFPLGELTKPEIRKIAEEQGFVNAKKKESQDICFVPKNQTGDYADFIEKYTGKTFPDGDFVDTSGNILGRHKGIIRYTIGQRRGLGLALKEPMYVLDKNVDNNTVILCRDEELYAKSLTAHDINLIPFDRIENRIRIKAKVRYNQTEQPAVVEQTGDDTLHIEFENPQRAITRGQAVVLYDGDVVVGGGTIS